jgi:hypothetical protein
MVVRSAVVLQKNVRGIGEFPGVKGERRVVAFFLGIPTRRLVNV